MMTHGDGDYGLSVAKTSYPTKHPVEPAYDGKSAVRFAEEEGPLFLSALGTIATHVCLPIYSPLPHVQLVGMYLAKFVDKLIVTIGKDRPCESGWEVDLPTPPIFRYISDYLSSPNYEVLRSWFHLRQIWSTLRPMEEFRSLKTVSNAHTQNRKLNWLANKENWANLTFKKRLEHIFLRKKMSHRMPNNKNTFNLILYRRSREKTLQCFTVGSTWRWHHLSYQRSPTYPTERRKFSASTPKVFSRNIYHIILALKRIIIWVKKSEILPPPDLGFTTIPL